MMSSNGTPGDGRAHVDFRTADAEGLRRVMDLGVHRALAEHRRAGRPIAVWDYESGEVRMVPPDQIPPPAADGDDTDEVPDDTARGPDF